MAFINTLPIIGRDDAKLSLLERKIGQEKDEIGDLKEEWEETKIEGIVQRKQNQEIQFTGTESKVGYFGMFLPDDILLIPKNKLENYRIKFVSDYETIVLKIKSFDPNLFIRQNRNHIEMDLEEDRKWK